MSALPEQLPLNYPTRSAQGRDDFLVADCNRDAVAWIDLWPEWPAPFLILYGPPACGKSHLAHIWEGQSQAQIVDVQSLTEENMRATADGADAFVLDDAEYLWGHAQGETLLFHFYNICKEEGKSALLTCQPAPVSQEFAVKDLASRLRAAPAVAIRAPEDDLIAALLIKQFQDRQLQVEPRVIDYILPRIERSFAAVRAVVARIDTQSLSQQKKVTVPLVSAVLTHRDESQSKDSD